MTVRPSVGQMGWHVARIVTPLAVVVLGLAACARQGAGPQSLAGGEYAVVLPDSARDALVIAARAVAAGFGDTATACVSYVAGHARFRVDTATIRRLGTARRFVARPACPPTYDSMILYVDSLGRPLGPTRPPGYVDPHHLGLVLRVTWGSGAAYVDIQASQGSGGREFACVVRRRPGGPVAECRMSRMWVH